MTASSSRLTEGCVDGSSRNHRHQNRLQTTPSEPNIQKDARQPAAEMIRITSGGAAAAPMRLLMNTAPCAAPRSVTGNHREKLREILGYAPASPRPNRNRATSSETKFQASPLAVVNADHHSTIRINVFRGPSTSPIQPLGISNTAYANVNALKIQPMCTASNPSSARMAGADEAMHTRSM